MDIRPVRRVVTGHDGSGRAVVVMDGNAGSVLHRPSRPGVALTDLWETGGHPSTEVSGDPAARPVALHPPADGTVFRVIQFDPEDARLLAAADAGDAFSAMGAGGDLVSGGRHPFMHRTDTVDYAVVLQGRITMLLDDQDVELGPGDVVVQNGTNHAWSNRGDEPCLMAFVLIDAPPGP